ncbi:hypothetical protein Tco_1301935 [Tanacetum coccineum]
MLVGKIKSVILEYGSKVRAPSRLSEACAPLLAILETCAPLAALEAHAFFTISEACLFSIDIIGGSLHNVRHILCVLANSLAVDHVPGDKALRQYVCMYVVPNRINEIESQTIKGKLMLLGDDGKLLKPCKPTPPSYSNMVSKKVDDLVNKDSDSEVEDVYKESHGEDPYNDDDFDDAGLTDAQMKFANAFDINLRGQLR